MSLRRICFNNPLLNFQFPYLLKSKFILINVSGVGEQCNSQNAQQAESDDRNEKSEVAIKNRKMSQSSDD